MHSDCVGTGRISIGLAYCLGLLLSSALSSRAKPRDQCYKAYTVNNTRQFIDDVTKCTKQIYKYTRSGIDPENHDQVATFLRIYFEVIVCFVKLFEKQCETMDAELISRAYFETFCAYERSHKVEGLYEFMSCRRYAKTVSYDVRQAVALKMFIEAASDATAHKRLQNFSQCASSVNYIAKKLENKVLRPLLEWKRDHFARRYLSPDALWVGLLVCKSGDMQCTRLKQVTGSREQPSCLKLCQAFVIHVLRCKDDSKQFLDTLGVSNMYVRCRSWCPQPPPLPPSPIIPTDKTTSRGAAVTAVGLTVYTASPSGIPKSLQYAGPIVFGLLVTVIGVLALFWARRTWAKTNRGVMNALRSIHPVNLTRYGQLPDRPRQANELDSVSMCSDYEEINDAASYTEVIEEDYTEEHRRTTRVVRRTRSHDIALRDSWANKLYDTGSTKINSLRRNEDGYNNEEKPEAGSFKTGYDQAEVRKKKQSQGQDDTELIALTALENRQA